MILFWTHPGIRDLLNDSDFTNDEAIRALLSFQGDATGLPPTVIDAHYPEQLVLTAFAAGVVVHCRYRTQYDDPRSCLISAFISAVISLGLLLTRSRPREREEQKEY